MYSFEIFPLPFFVLETGIIILFSMNADYSALITHAMY